MQIVLHKRASFQFQFINFSYLTTCTVVLCLNHSGPFKYIKLQLFSEAHPRNTLKFFWQKTMSVNTLKRSFDQISDLMETPIKANQTLNNNNTTLTMEANNVLEGSIYSTVDESTMQMEKLFMKAKKQKKVF